MFKWVKSHVTLREYLGLHLIFGLLVSLFCLWVFARLADHAFRDSWVVTLDNIIVNQLHLGANSTATLFFLMITQLGGPVIWLVGLVIAIFLISRYPNWRFRVAIWGIALLGGQFLNSALKLWFARPRPVFDEPIAIAAQYSFPSGHAMMSLITYGLAAYFLVISTPYRSRKLLFITSAVLIIGLVGLSRLYLGVHYLSDVVGGYAAGAIWLITCMTALDFLQFRESRKNTELKEQDTDNGNRQTNDFQ